MPVTLYHVTEPRLQISERIPLSDRPTFRLKLDVRWRRPALKSSYRGHSVAVVATYVKVALGRREWSGRYVNELYEEAR